MASILRKIVAGPRAPHPEANLDLCYVTDNIIATSGPAGSYPTRAYRNPLPQLVRWLDDNHGPDWAIWEFRAEGTGYPDQDVYGRVHHFPWPDHHPPPFVLVPDIMATMRDWAQGKDVFPTDDAKPGESDTADPASKQSRRVIVVHCKAGKGRSGSMAVSYLLSEQGWTRADALQRFTDRRMRPGFGAGVSIPSQLRWIGYVERWARHGKLYVEQRLQVTEVHVWGLRDGVKLSLEGYIDRGKKIKTFHIFGDQERDDLRDVGDVNAKGDRKGDGLAEGGTDSSTETHMETEQAPHLIDIVADVMKRKWNSTSLSRSASRSTSKSRQSGTTTPRAEASDNELTPQTTESVTSNAIFRPATPIYIPTNDVNLSVERRSHASYGLMMVTSVAHVWFNAFFEGHGPENMSSEASTVPEKGNPDRGPDQSGVFHIKWEHMDGLKGSSTKGYRAFDRAAVVWRVVPSSDPIAPAVDTLRHAATEPGSTGKEDDDDPKGSSGEAIKELQRQATERSHAAELSGATALDERQAQAAPDGKIIRQPSDGKDVDEPSPADWRGVDPVREGHERTEREASPMKRDLGLQTASSKGDKEVEELEKAADSDEDGTDGIRRGITAVYDGAAKVAESVTNTVAGTTSTADKPGT